MEYLIRSRHKVLTYIEYRALSGVFRNIDPPPPHRPASVYTPPLWWGRKTHSLGVRGWGVNSLEDARHWIGLLQYNPSTVHVIKTFLLSSVPYNSSTPWHSLQRSFSLSTSRRRLLADTLFCFHHGLPGLCSRILFIASWKIIFRSRHSVRRPWHSVQSFPGNLIRYHTWRSDEPFPET